MKSEKLKIIYIANLRLPTEKAHGHQISKMCEQLAKEGSSVELWVPKRKNNIKDDAFSFYNLKRNFKIKKIFCLDLFFLEKLIGPLSFWLEFLSFYSLTFLKVIFLRRNIIIYTREPLVCLFKILNFKIVFECHSISKKEKMFFSLSRLANKIIVISSGLKDIFSKNGFGENKVLVASDAVDLSIFDIDIDKKTAREKLNLPQDPEKSPGGDYGAGKKIIAYTGKFKTMGMDKGISDILKALSSLSDDVLFLAVGGSEDDINYYQKQAKELKVENKVKLLGHVSQSELAIYQKAADILLMPFPYNQHYAHYMSPLKMFEYMAAKRPIIASDLPSIKEVLNKNNSVIVKPDNPESLAQGIKSIFDSEKLSQKISKQAFADVKDYTWNKRVKKIIKFIKI